MAIKIAGTEVINDNKRVLNNEALPDVRPSLLLDFANSKTLDPRITFTRGSTATYWDGKTTTKAEENLQGGSSLFNTTYWLFAQCTFTADYTTAPDGTSTAVRLIEDSSPNYHYLHGQTSNTVSTTSGTTYTWSIYAKKGAGTSAPDIVQLCFRGNTHSTAYANFNISTGAVTGSADVVSSSITSVGNGWYRLVVTATANSSGSGGGGVFSFTNNGPSATRLPIYTGNTNADVLLWGPQFEQRSSATAYTPTTSSPIVKYQPTLQTAASGEARFDHDPVTGESKGLLIEEARTNSVNYSTDFSVSAWTKGGVSVQADNIVAPDGSLYNDNTIRENSSNTEHLIYNGNTTVGTNDTFTMSVFAKNGAISPRRYLGLRNNSLSSGAMAVFDLQEGTVVDTNASGNYSVVSTSIEDVGNGWYRCSVVMSDGGDGYREMRIQMVNSATPTYTSISSVTYTGDGVSTLIIWGAQMEINHSFPTSYIPTSGSTVTRSRDDAKMTDSNFTDWYNYGEGTLYVEAPVSAASGITTNMIASINDNTNDNAIQIYSNASNNLTTQILAFSTVYYSETISSADGSGNAAIGYALDNTFFAANGVGDNSGTDTSVQPPSLVDQLRIGSYANGGLSRNGPISKIAFYSQRLSNATLQAMTEA